MSIRIVLTPDNGKNLSFKEKLKLQKESKKLLSIPDEVVYVMSPVGASLLDPNAVNVYIDDNFTLFADDDISDEDKARVQAMQDSINKLRGKK